MKTKKEVGGQRLYNRMHSITKLKLSVAKILLFAFLCNGVFMPALTPLFAQQSPDDLPSTYGEGVDYNVVATPMTYGQGVDYNVVGAPVYGQGVDYNYSYVPGNVSQRWKNDNANRRYAEMISKENNEKPGPEFGCELKSFGEDMVSACVAAGLYYLFFLPAYKIAGWISIFLNWVITELVVKMGKLVNNLTAISVAWQTLRDVANVFLVFLTIYVGIATILGISGFGAKQLLWKIVLSALLVNFSITFTKAVIDVSNVVAINIYDQFLQTAGVESGCASPSVTEASNNACINNGLAGAFWTQLKITTIFNAKKTVSDPNKKADINWGIALTMFMGGFLMIVLAFVFGAAAFLLVGRFAFLVFLIIVSPIGLVAWLTGISGQGQKWWSALLNQSFFAPLIFLMWWISYKVLGSYADTFTGGTIAAAIVTPGTPGGNISGINIVLMYVVIMTFLVIGLVLAKQLGAMGAKTVISVGKTGSAATAGFLAANTLGRASAMAQRKYSEKMAAAQNNFAETGTNSMLNRFSTSKYGSKVDRGLNTALGAGAGMKFAGTSSFADRKLSTQKASSERQKEITTAGRHADVKRAAGVLNDGTNRWMIEQGQTNATIEAAQKTIKGASQADIEHLHANEGNKAVTPVMQNTYTKKQASALAAREDATPAQKASLTEAAYKGERTALRTSGANQTEAHIKTIQSMSVADHEENADDLRKNSENIRHLSPEKYEQIVQNKNSKWTDGDLGQFSKARYTNIQAGLDGAIGSDLGKAVQKLDNKDLELVGPEIFENPKFIQSLTDKQYTHLTKTKRSNFSERQLNQFETERKNYFSNLPDDKAVEKVKTADPETLAGLDHNFLKREKVIAQLDPRSVNEMVKKGLTKEKRDHMWKTVDTMYNEIQVPGTVAHSLSREEKENVEKLYDWFTNSDKASV